MFDVTKIYILIVKLNILIGKIIENVIDGLRGMRYVKKNAKNILRNLQIMIFVLPLHSQSAIGALVQLVRIRACHARGQGFESPTHRKLATEFFSVAFFCA